MKKADIIKQLKQLQEIKPDDEWRNLSKNQLLSQISTINNNPERLKSEKLPIFVFSRSYKMASVFCAIMLLFSGIIGIAQSASIDNPFYSVKIGLEKMVVAVAPEELQMDLKMALTQQIVSDLTKTSGDLENQLAIQTVKKNLDEIAIQLQNIDHPSEVAMISDKVQQKTSQIKSELKQVPVDKINTEIKNSFQSLENQVGAVESQAFALKSQAEEKINNCPAYLEQDLIQLKQKIELSNPSTSTLNQLQKINDYLVNNRCIDALVILDNLQKQLDN
ncbi:MAG TPA: hypothetical protein PKX03_02165 [Candidatus Paceibacterota bacterium]|nr:hypothetical protein [Candidatus Paceibacterota bacterium]